MAEPTPTPTTAMGSPAVPVVPVAVDEGQPAAGSAAPQSPAQAPSPSPQAASAPPTAPLATRSAWDRTEILMKVGEVQRVAVNLFNVRSLKDLSIAVRGDSPVIEFVEIGPGQLLSVDGAQVLAERQLEGTRASATLKRATPLAGGTGTVVVVGFRAVRAGEATIVVDSLSLSSGTAQALLPLTGTVRVTVTP
jgi:hypothetical protein